MKAVYACALGATGLGLPEFDLVAPRSEHALTGSPRLRLRPMLPHDALPLAQLFTGLSLASRRSRFHGALNLSLAQVQRMCHPDPGRELALVVSLEGDNAEHILVAEGRSVADAEGRQCECALLVHEAWRRRGIGTWVMQAIQSMARRAGRQRLVGDVLRDNVPMLALLRQLGFTFASHPEESRLVQARLELTN